MTRPLSPLRQADVRLARWFARHGLATARIGTGVVFLWFGILHFLPGAHPELDTPAHVLSILSVGRLTDAASVPLLAGWEVLIGLGLCSGVWPGVTMPLLALRLVLALLPLVMFRDDLFRSFPFTPLAAGQDLILQAVLMGVALALTGSERAARLRADAALAPWFDEPPLNAEEMTSRRRRTRRAVGLAVLLLAVAGGTAHALWPRYLQWFHARQEATTLNQKMAGQLIKKSMPLSPLLHRKITTWVYLPPGYDHATARYPAVYAMHGMPGEVRDCFVKGRLQDMAENLILTHQIQPLIIVGWDGEGPDGPTDITNFLDRADGQWPMEDFIVHELVPYIDRTYRTVPQPGARSLDGLSAGGFAAVNLGFKHPDVFTVLASHNGFFDPADDAKDMTAILGPPGPRWDHSNPMKLARQLPPTAHPHVYMDIGAGDDLMDEFKKFRDELLAQHIDCEAHIFPGRHSWEFWSEHFNDSLRFADKRFRSKV